MNNIILETIKFKLLVIYHNGIKINNTKEILNDISVFYISDININKEKKSIKNFYNKYIGNWDERQKLEKTHYEFLKAAINHKIDEVQYFFNLKKDDFSSRKIVAHSNDCISAIQFVSRPNINILNVFARSSDSLNLLVSDYLFSVELFKFILKERKINSHKNDKVVFFTTSCHYYLKDNNKIEKILNDSNKISST